MDDDVNKIVQAHIWQDIIRLGFSPSKGKDQDTWLWLYGQGLKDFWQTASYPCNPSNKNKISFPEMKIEYDHHITSFEKFSITLLHVPPINDKHVMWTHDMDGKNYFTPPLKKLLIDRKEKRAFARKMKKEDVEMVVDSLITHPSPHQHIESPVLFSNENIELQNEKNHMIRIGGGIQNPFVYLFHLRFQLCPDADMRKAEHSRLVSLFETAIKANDSQIPPKKLMEIPN